MWQITSTLWEHQKAAKTEALSSLDKRGYFWYMAGCATGKTLTSLAIMHALGIQRALVVTTKAAMRSAWYNDVQQHTTGLTCTVLEKGSSGDKAKLLHNYGLLVVNYETAAIIWSQIRDAGFPMVILDESHKVKSHKSKQSINLAKACEDTPYKIALTGTPYEDRPTDAYGQVRWFDPILRTRGYPSSKVLGSWNAFFEDHVIYRQDGHIKIPLSYKNHSALAERIKPFSLRVNTDDVLDLPPALETKVYVQAPREVKKAMDELRLEYLADLQGKSLEVDNALALALRLEMLTGGTYKGEKLYHSPKIDAVKELVESFAGEPCVIFSRFTHDVALLKAELSGSIKLLTGDTKEHLEFQAGEGDILIANIAAGSAGVNLSRARYCIFYSTGYSATDYNQAIWRVRRPGSKYPIMYYHILMQNTIDETIYRIRTGKQDHSSKIKELINDVCTLLR